MDANNNKAAEDLFASCGMEARRIQDTIKNAKLTEALTSVLKEAKSISEEGAKANLNLLYTVASTLAPEAVGHRNVLVKYVTIGKIDKITLPVALNYLKKLGADPLDVPTFEKEAGVGVKITEDDVKKAVTEYLNEIKTELTEKKYHYPIMGILNVVRDKLKFANPKDIKDEVDKQLLALLGPKEKDTEKKPKKEPKKPETTKTGEPIKELVTFPDPKDNKQKRPELLEAHLKATNGVVMCRFPPEPNGYLHVGHAKSMNLNFSYPRKSGGHTYLRFDDTNPEAEKEEYFEAIIDDVKWLGHTPWKITYSSDYFPQLYELAIKLIKAGKAYVCHQKAEEIKEYRQLKKDSPYRNRSVEENLREFENMKKGKYDEGEATLRMKMDMSSDNTVMRDLIAYRIKYTPHPHAGDEWCIYPSYDYTHCIIDSLENITHSLCTLEFEVRRASYYQLLDDLDLYKPLVWEYSRLNITNTVLSKRKLIMLVKGGYVKGWDDPRLPTIRGFRRRGYTADAINNFCDKIGVTRSDNLINLTLLENCVRDDLDKKTDRALAVLEPLKVTLINYEGEPKWVDCPKHPKEKERGTHRVPFGNVIYIEKSDFRLEDKKGYKRLAPNKEVGLLHAGFTITCTEVVKNSKGEPIELKAKLNLKPTSKPQGYINWVSAEAGKEPVKVEVRLYDKLFKSEEPATVDDWLGDLNPNSLVVTHALVCPLLDAAKVGDSFQWERIGYFTKDKDSTPEQAVWNRIVTLKETKWED